jgi:heat shock protein HtpX
VLITQENLHTVDDKLRRIYETVERIAKQSSISMPEVGYYESSDPNAFATGPSKNNSLVAVSTGLLQSMTNEEIE